jgi:hypothetical protein
MGMSEYFDELKEVLEDCKDYGYYLAACCPFHTDTRPSLFVYEDKYRCSSCGSWGETKDLLKRLDKTKVKYRDYDEQKAVNPFSRWLRTNSLYQVCKSSWDTLNHFSNFRGYILRRGVEEHYRKALGIGYKDDWYTIPIFSKEGTLVGCVARANPETQGKSKYIQPHGQNPNLLYAPNWRLYDRANVVYLAYGIFDAITLAINGVMAFSSISGKLTNPIGFSEIRKKIVIIPDLGEDKEANILASRLGWRGEVAHIKYSENCKDLNDIWVKDRNLFKDVLNELVRFE